MNEINLKNVILKNIWWLGIIVIAAVFFRVDMNYNNAFPLENAAMLKGNLILNSEGANVLHDNYSLPFYSVFFSFGSLLVSRITSLILSIFMLFFFYKFAERLFNDKSAAIFSVIFIAIESPIIFLGKFATVDILSLTLFSTFLMVIAEIFSLEDRSKKVPFMNIPKLYFCPVTASVLFTFAAFSNYIVFLYLIPASIIILLKDKKSALYFVLTTLILSIIIYILSYQLINNQLSNIYGNNIQDFKFSKLLIRIAEYLAIPIMIAYSTLQILWKTDFRSSWVYTLILSSLIIPLYIIISDEVFNIFRLIPFSLILISPLCGLVISKFININPSYKYATIFAIFFITAVSYWQLTKLETAYPQTDTVVKYCKEYFDKNTVVYSEDPYLISNNFYPFIGINNFKSLYYLDSKKNIALRKQDIINQIDNGMVDYVILNGLFHKELTDYLKEKILKQKYMRVMTQEFTINTLMYPLSEEEGTFDIYKIEPQYKLLRRFLASK